MAAAMSEGAVADLQRSHGKYIYHGTDVHAVESIVANGLLPGGGPGGRLANHFVVGPMPSQWSEYRGFRRGSNAVVQCDLEVLRKSGVRLFKRAHGVLLADGVPPEAIFRVLAADNQRGQYTEVLAEVGADRVPTACGLGLDGFGLRVLLQVLCRTYRPRQTHVALQTDSSTWRARRLVASQ